MPNAIPGVQMVRTAGGGFALVPTEPLSDAAKLIVAHLEKKNAKLAAANAKLRARLTGHGSYLPEWIEASTELPDADLTVIVAWTPDIVTLEDLEDPVETGFFDGQIWRSSSTLPLDPEPTHWMYFPDPPEA